MTDGRGGLPAYRARVAERNRAAILDAAVKAFIEQGYDRATLETIARSAEVSTGTLFKHFSTKAALFGAIMARVWENEPGAGGRLPPWGELRAGLTAIGLDYARLLRAPNVDGLFRVIIAEAPRFPELGQELYRRGKAPYLSRLRTYLEAEVAAGNLQISTDRLPIAKRQFLGMINDQIFWPRLLIVDLEITEAEVRSVVDSAVTTFLRAWEPPSMK